MKRTADNPELKEKDRVVVPVGQGWASWFDGQGGVSEDFMQEREQPRDQERSALE